MKRVLRGAAQLTVALILLGIALPFLLVASDWPARGGVASGETLKFHRSDFTTTSVERETWTAPDGVELSFRRYSSANPNAPLVVMIHGSGLHSGQLEHLATALAADGAADVLVPDLRGHGPTPDRRGDIAYIGQLEDDLAALIDAHARPGQEVVLLGHSSGGGLVARFSGGAHGAMADRAILLAPYLGHDAPTTRPKAGGWAHPLLRRYIGLEILTGFGVTAFNGLTVVQLNVPEPLQTGPEAAAMTSSYSYRLNTSYHPRPDLGADLASLPDVLLIAGAQDEAFVANLYQPTMEAFTTRGTYHILPDVGHMDVVDASATSDLIKEWLR
ncbi:MAG: alpha/beta fold hydrolase [Pseudomonadota bacterium]